MVTVSIIVPCRNEEKHIRPFLDCLLAQVAPGGQAHEFLISDGMSNDGTREILREYQTRFPSLQIVDNPRQIVSTALNAGITNSHGEIVVRMDVHSEYAPNYIEQCVRALNESGADNVGGPAIAAGNTYMQRAISAAYRSPFGCGGARFHDPSYEGFVDTVPYGCWRKATLEKLGLFDEMLVRNQDDELNFRLVLNGGKIWQTPRIQSWYRPRSSLKALAKQYAQYGYWKVFVMRKHKMPASLRQLVPPGFALSLIALTATTPFFPLARLLLGLLLVLYFLASTTAAILACRQPNERSCTPILPLVFLVYHLSYGLGFLRGLIDVFFLRRGPAQSFSALVR